MKSDNIVDQYHFNLPRPLLGAVLSRCGEQPLCGSHLEIPLLDIDHLD
jgi:hypothetical protein